MNQMDKFACWLSISCLEKGERPYHISQNMRKKAMDGQGRQEEMGCKTGDLPMRCEQKLPMCTKFSNVNILNWLRSDIHFYFHVLLGSLPLMIFKRFYYHISTPGPFGSSHILRIVLKFMYLST